MLGFHIIKNMPKTRTYEECLDEVESRGCTAVQIFVSGPRSKKMILINHKELKKTAKEKDISLYAHNSYFGSPWSDNPATIQFVKDQLDVCEKSGIKGFVIHLPKKPLSVVIDILPKIVHSKVEILLEIPAVKSDPNLSWETPHRINLLCKAIKKAKIKNTFICVDTSHIFACGLDLTTKKQAKKWLKDIKYPNMIHMIHLNDSQVPLGNNKDVHAQIHKGEMWKGLPPKKSGMGPFIEFGIDNDIPIILERAGLKNMELDTEIQIIKKNFDI